MKKTLLIVGAAALLAISLFAFRQQPTVTVAEQNTTIGPRQVTNQPGAFVIENFTFLPKPEKLVEIVFDVVNKTEKDVHYFEIVSKGPSKKLTLGFYNSETKMLQKGKKIQWHRVVSEDFTTAENLAVNSIVFTDGSFVGDAKRGGAIVAEREAVNGVAAMYATRLERLNGLTAAQFTAEITAMRESVMLEARKYPKRDMPVVRNDAEYIDLAREQAWLSALLDLATGLESLEKKAIQGAPELRGNIDRLLVRVKRYQ
jgi:hypothetical protein